MMENVVKNGIKNNKENKNHKGEDKKKVLNKSLNKKYNINKINITGKYICKNSINLSLTKTYFIIICFFLITGLKSQQILEIEAQINSQDEINYIIKKLNDYLEVMQHQLLININQTYQIKDDDEFNNDTILIKIYSSSLSICTYNSMFKDLSNIIMINFTNFNGINDGDMSSMFKGCKSLKSIYFNDFDTSYVFIE